VPVLVLETVEKEAEESLVVDECARVGFETADSLERLKNRRMGVVRDSESLLNDDGTEVVDGFSCVGLMAGELEKEDCVKKLGWAAELKTDILELLDSGIDVVCYYATSKLVNTELE
jgi:hypothetical protein